MISFFTYWESYIFDNVNQPDKYDNNYDRLWKMNIPFDHINDAKAKFYSPSENLAVNEVPVLFTGRVIFKQ